jgi:hypothetical protein
MTFVSFTIVEDTRSFIRHFPTLVNNMDQHTVVDLDFFTSSSRPVSIYPDLYANLKHNYYNHLTQEYFTCSPNCFADPPNSV